MYLVSALTNIDNVSIVPTSTYKPSSPPDTPSSPATCTGCILEAFQPVTYAFAEADSSSWTSVVMTATLVTKTISYFTEISVLQTIVTEVETVVQPTALTGSNNEKITYTTPVLTVEPTPGVTLELPAGTYLFYDKIYGGLNVPASAITHQTQPEPELHTYIVPHPKPPIFPGRNPRQIFGKRIVELTCAASVKTLEVIPVRTEDWTYFYQSVTATAPWMGSKNPRPLPPGLLKYLNNVPEIQRVFSGANISSCTQTGTPGTEYPGYTSSAEHMQTSGIFTVSAAPPLHSSLPASISPTPTTSKTSYISTTYQTTSTHISVRGCLRCDNAYTLPPSYDKSPVETTLPPSHNAHPGGTGGMPYDTDPESPGKPSYADISLLSIGGDALVANSYGQYVFASQTLSPGGSPITINGYTLSLAPGSKWAVVNGVTQTLSTSPIITEAPKLTVGSQTVIGAVRDGTTEYDLGGGTTLRPGDAVTISGAIYSLDNLGTALVINGYTSTIPEMPKSSAPPTASKTTTRQQDAGQSVETESSTSSRGSAGSFRRESLELRMESVVMSFASWCLMFL